MHLSMRIRRWLRVGGFIAMTVVLVGGLSAQESAAGEQIVSERRDPATGMRWVLMRDAAHPAAPARWVLAGTGAEKTVAGSTEVAQQRPVIRAGDRIVVEKQTAVIDAWLEATALTSAGSGEPLRARLAIGGRVLVARALAPGRAEMEETQ
jgi:hypothetical protein